MATVAVNASAALLVCERRAASNISIELNFGGRRRWILLALTTCDGLTTPSRTIYRSQDRGSWQ